MSFEELLDQAVAMLQRRGRLTYRTLQRQFTLDDETLADFKEEIIDGQRLAMDEAGIGKSRLVQVLKEHVASEPQAWLTPCQCSPYHQNSMLYPMLDLLERVALQCEREESPEQKLRKLEGLLVQYGLPLAEAVPLFAALLSLPLPADYVPLHVAPEQQRQQTLQAFLTILLRSADQQPVLFVMEDLHWVDPTTLEFLSLLVAQGPTALGSASGRPRSIGSRGSCCWRARRGMTQRREPVFIRPSTLRAASRPSRWSYGQR